MRPDQGIINPLPDLEPVRPPFNSRPLIALVVVTVLCLGGWMLANRDDGWLHDVDDGLDVAATNGLPVFVYFGADWCPPCVQFRAQVLSDPYIEAGLMERYVLVKVDLTSRSGANARVAQDFGVRVIPTVILLNAKGYEIERVTGGALMPWTQRKARR